jgi:hypothetical protein
MQLRVKQGRPLNLKYAVRHAVDLEACNKAESKRNEGCIEMRLVIKPWIINVGKNIDIRLVIKPWIINVCTNIEMRLVIKRRVLGNLPSNARQDFGGNVFSM